MPDTTEYQTLPVDTHPFNLVFESSACSSISIIFNGHQIINPANPADGRPTGKVLFRTLFARPSDCTPEFTVWAIINNQTPALTAGNFENLAIKI